MIDIETIEKEILDLEKKDTSYAVVERLSWLYTVRDHIKKAPEITGRLLGGEFMEACSNVPIQSVLSVLSEHMEAVKIVYPKEYEQVVKRIRAIKESAS